MSPHPLDTVERVPRTCIWEITGACNLRCIHCENHCGRASEAELSIEEMFTVAEGLATLGCKVVDVTGGEPLMRSGWERLCRRISDLGMKVALITNGTLLDDDALQRVIDSGVHTVGISLDGMQQVHDVTRVRAGQGPSAWRQAVDGLTRAARNLETVAITQVNVHNLPELGRMRQLLGELGVRRWQLQLCVPTGRLLDHDEPYVIGPEQLEELTGFIADAAVDDRLPRIDTGDNIGYYTEREVLLRRRTTGQGFWVGCSAGIRAVAITYEGRVRGCSALPGDFDAGDLHEESIEEIWEDPERFVYTTGFDHRKLDGDCKKCRYGHVCRAGCTTMAWWVTGTIYDNPYCLHRVRESRG